MSTTAWPNREAVRLVRGGRLSFEIGGSWLSGPRLARRSFISCNSFESSSIVRWERCACRFPGKNRHQAPIPSGKVLNQDALENYGGETGIRTLDRVSPIHAFQACAFNHSAISPAHCFRIARSPCCSPNCEHRRKQSAHAE